MRRSRRHFRIAVRRVLTAAVLLAVPHPASANINAPGDPDLSFGGGTGWMTLPVGDQGARGMALQPDGRIVLTGRARETPGGRMLLAVWRFHPDGSPDTSFNGTGQSSVVLPQNRQSTGNAVALSGDGRIVVAGDWMEAPSPIPENFPFHLLACFLPDGRPDPAFGPNGQGFVMTGNHGSSLSVTMQPDGKILTGGSNFTATSAVFRFLSGGSPDSAFGTNGRAPLPEGGFASSALVVQSDGKILASRAGAAFTVNRLLPDGAVDGAFGMDGTAGLFLSAPQSGICSQITVSSDGRILLAGTRSDTSAAIRGFQIARLLPGGALDPSFGDPATPGSSFLSFGNTISVYVSAMQVQSDGRILTAGGVAVSQDTPDLALARFTAAGLPDNSFGTGGRVFTDVGGSREELNGGALLTDQKFFAAGYYTPPGNLSAGHILLARWHVPPAAALIVEHPPGTELWPWSAAPLDFGPVTAGTGFIEIALQNGGLEPLTNLQTAITGESIPGEFHTNQPANIHLSPGARTTFHVSLTPSAAPGVRTATLQISTATPGVPPRTVPLTGSKATPLEIWRVTWFGSPDNSGPGADLNDFDSDSLPNFMEYALRTHPHTYTAGPCQPAGTGSFTYTRPAAALTEFSYQPESAPSPHGPWASEGLTTTILTDDGTVQTVQVMPAGNPPAPRLFLRLRITKR